MVAMIVVEMECMSGRIRISETNVDPVISSWQTQVAAVLNRELAIRGMFVPSEVPLYQPVEYQ